MKHTKKKSTDRVRAFRERQRANNLLNKPPKKPPKSALERKREYRARQKALRALIASSTHNPAEPSTSRDTFTGMDDMVGKENQLKDQECQTSLLEPAVQLSIVEYEQNEGNVLPFDSLKEVPNVKDQEENLAYQGNTDMVETIIPEGNELVYNAYKRDVIVKEEPIDPQERQETKLEDFIYSNDSTNFKGSNTVLEKTKEYERRQPLYRFSKVLKAVAVAEYETLQTVYQLLYQRSAWDTHEILKQRILQFSGFNFNSDSEEYLNRDMMLRTQSNNVLVKIGRVLGLDQIRNMREGGDKARIELIAAIMQFLTVMKFFSRKRTTSTKTGAEDASLQTKCGCRNGCMEKITHIQHMALLQYLKELQFKNLLDNYLLNLIEIKKNVRKRVFIEDSKKIREIAYQYKVKVGLNVLVVCKGGFCNYHGLKQSKVVQLQNKLKKEYGVPLEIDMQDLPPFIVLPSPNKVSIRESCNETQDNDETVSSFQYPG